MVSGRALKRVWLKWRRDQSYWFAENVFINEQGEPEVCIAQAELRDDMPWLKVKTNGSRIRVTLSAAREFDAVGSTGAFEESVRVDNESGYFWIPRWSNGDAISVEHIIDTVTEEVGSW